MPVAPAFVVLAGTPEARVKDVAVRRVSVEYAAYKLPSTGMREAQSAINVSNAAIHATSAEGFVFARGRVAHVGAHGIWLRDEAQGQGHGQDMVTALIRRATARYGPPYFRYPVAIENRPSRRIAEKLGGTIIGRYRIQKHDGVIYAIPPIS